jgi:hypothetical protein
MRSKLEEVSILEGLKPTAITSERIAALVASGVTAVLIAKATGVKISSLRNWSSGVVEPRAEAAETLDYMRVAMQILTEGGLPPERAGQVMKSRDPRPPHDRIMDIVGVDPERAIESAEHFLQQHKTHP